jgi:hypothetical protein
MSDIYIIPLKINNYNHMKILIICLLFCLPFVGSSQGQDSISPAQKAFLEGTIESLNNLMVKGLEMTGDSVVASEEFLSLINNPEYRNQVYPEIYTWQQTVNFMSAMELKKTFWFYINLYSESDTNKELVLKAVLSYDQMLKMDEVMTNAFSTYCFADPEVSVIKEGKPEIIRPDILEEKLRNVKEIVAYIHAYRKQKEFEAKM